MNGGLVATMQTYFTFPIFEFSDTFFWCFHMTLATITNSRTLISIIAITGRMKAQMKWLFGFKKHLHTCTYSINQVRNTFLQCLRIVVTIVWLSWLGKPYGQGEETQVEQGDAITGYGEG